MTRIWKEGEGRIDDRGKQDEIRKDKKKRNEVEEKKRI